MLIGSITRGDDGGGYESRTGIAVTGLSVG